MMANIPKAMLHPRKPKVMLSGSKDQVWYYIERNCIEVYIASTCHFRIGRKQMQEALRIQDAAKRR